jgi:hypothetical protein
MKSISDVTACFIDHGTFLPLALKLAESYGRVLYHTPCEQGFMKVEDCVIGDGFREQNVERCDDIWKVLKDVDLFIFPDIHHSGLQKHLKELGHAVWGSQGGDVLEMQREMFHRKLDELEMDVPVYEVVVGITTLREHLRDKEDKIIKISKYRGSLETCKWSNWTQDNDLLDEWALQFGAVKELVRFLVFDKIETDIELGCDTFCVDGRWPDNMIQGYENKDQGFFSAVRKRGEMPGQVKEVLDKFGPELAAYGYRNSFSMEIRVKGDKSYFIDPCCRFPMPPTSSKMELWRNLPDIIWRGAQGDMVEPEPMAKFAAECVLSMKVDKDRWATVEVPDKLKQWMKVFNCCQVDGALSIPPNEFRGSEIGWLVAIGDTMEETIENLKAQVELLPPGVTAHMEALPGLIAEIQEAESQGMEFTDQKVPEPETALMEK